MAPRQGRLLRSHRRITADIGIVYVWMEAAFRPLLTLLPRL